MTSSFRVAAIMLCFVLGFQNLHAQGRRVIICLDESGSMNDSWDELNYALQTIIALIDENDELIIITGGGVDELHINSRRKNAEVKKWHPRFRRENNSEYAVIPKANKLIKKNTKKETLIIFIGDGEWMGSEAPGTELTRIYAAQKPRIIFFKIGAKGKTPLEAALSGIPTLEVIFTPSGNSRRLKANLNELAHKIVEGKQGNVKPYFGGSRVGFKPIFPLKKVIVLLQDPNCSLSGINSGYKLDGPINITNRRVGGSLEGKCYEITSKSGAVIDIGEEISLACSNTDCCSSSNSNLKFIPIVALDLKSRPTGNFIETDEVKREYTLCDKETEITLHSFLINKNSRKIKLDKLSGLRITADNGSASQSMSFSGDQASGTIKLHGNTTYVTVEASYDGYFQKKSNIFTFIRKRCPLKLEVSVSGDVERSTVDNYTYNICQGVKLVDFSAGIIDESGLSKAFSKFRSVEIFLKSGSKKTTLKKRGDKVFGSLDLGPGDSKASLLLEVNGVVVYESATYTFRRVPCGPHQDTTILTIEPAPVMDFAQEGLCVENVKIYKSDDNEIDYHNYTFEVTNVPIEFNVNIDTSSNDLRICFEKKAFVCDCFIRHGTFGGTIIAHPKKPGLIQVEKEWTLTLVKENSFVVRCKTCLIAALILGVLIWYTYGIWTKPRFHKTARLDVIQVDRTSIYAPPSKRPRKKLRTTFFNRYLVPYVPESTLIDGLKFKAHHNKTSIYLAKESVSEKLSKNGEPLNPKTKKDILVFRNNTLELEKRQNITTIYTLKVK